MKVEQAINQLLDVITGVQKIFENPLVKSAVDSLSKMLENNVLSDAKISDNKISHNTPNIHVSTDRRCHYCGNRMDSGESKCTGCGGK